MADRKRLEQMDRPTAGPSKSKPNPRNKKNNQRNKPKDQRSRVKQTPNPYTRSRKAEEEDFQRSGDVTPPRDAPSRSPSPDPRNEDFLSQVVAPIADPISPDDNDIPRVHAIRSSFIGQRNEFAAEIKILTDQIRELKEALPKLPVEPAPFVPNADLFVKHISKIYSLYKPRVPANYVEWYKEAVGGDCAPTGQDALGENPHTPEAILRSNTLNYMIPELIKLNPKKFMENPIITFLYGSETRDRNTINRYNRELVKLGYPTDYIRCVFYGNSITPDDLKRRMTTDQTYSPFAILMDVYELGAQDLTPVNISNLGFDYWVWAGHPFFDMYGGILESYYVRYLDENNNDRVVFKPDTINNAYPPHSPCDIFHKSGSMPCDRGYVSWSVAHRMHLKVPQGDKFKRVIAYSITIGRNTEHQYAELPSITSNPTTVIVLNTIDFENGAPFWTNFFSIKFIAKLGLCKHVTVCVDAALRQYVQAALLTKYYNQWSWNSCLKAVNEYLESDRYYKKCEMMMPLLFQNYRLRVATALYMESSKAKADLTGSMVAVSGSYMHQANQAVNRIGKEQILPWSKTNAALLAVGFGAIALYTVWRRKISLPKLAVIDVEGIKVDTDGLPYKIGFEIGSKIIAPLSRLTERIGVTVNKLVQTCDLMFNLLDLAWPVVAIPVLEENFKRCTSHRFLPSLLLGFLDVVNQPLPYEQTPLFFWSRVACHTAAHYALSRIPIRKAMVIHGSWNLLAFLANVSLCNSVPKLCSFDGICSEARARGKRCSYLEDVMNITSIFDTSSFCRRILTEDEVHYSINTFDEMVDSGDFTDPMTPFTVPYNPEDAWRPASECLPKLPLNDPSVIFSEDSCEEFKTDLRIPTDQQLGYYRYWAHNVPMFRPSTSGHNTYFMVRNRLSKAPPALLEANIANPSIITIRNLMDVYKNPIESLGAILTCFDSVNLTPYCNFKNRYSRAMKRLDKGDFSAFSVPYQYATFMVDKPNHVFFERDEGYEEFLLHLPGPKRALMRQMRERDDINPLQENSPETNQTTVSSKTDEVLFKRDWVPRPIHREAPQFSYKVGRVIYGVSENIKKFFWFRRISLCTEECCLKQDMPPPYHVLYISDLSGKTDLLLSEWFDFVCRTEGWHVAASGDDSLLILNLGWTLYIMEGDVSQCDHSVRKATLVYEWSTLYSFGASKETINLLRRNAASTLMIEHKLSQTKIYLSRSAERNTGSPDTTIGNTLIVSGLWCSFVNHFRKMHSLDEFAADPKPFQKYFLSTFGFSMKIKNWITTLDCSNFVSPTILKGWFLHTPNNTFAYSWSPLPSRILKLSKIMTKPRTVFKHTKIPKTNDNDVSLDQAWLCLVSMHRGLEPFVNLPYIDQWRMLSFARYSLYQYDHAYMPPISCVPVVHESFTEAHRTKASTTHKDVICPCWRKLFIDRYNISEVELQDFCDMMENIIPLTFNSHPVFTALATVDYY